jgi:hypothetical protein
MKTIIKTSNGAGGFQFSFTKKASSLRFKKENIQAIGRMLDNSDVEGVYQTPNGRVKAQLLNGVSMLLDTKKSIFQ